MENKKIDWAHKLSSRKFWAAVVGFVGPLMGAFGMADNVVVQVTSLIMAGGALIAYIIAEGWVDAQHTDKPADGGSGG